MKKEIAIVLMVLLFVKNTKAQVEKTDIDSTYTPYELLSTYYNSNFKPFKKSNAFIGLAFSLEDKKQTNVDYLIEQVLNGERMNYDILLKGGYYIGNYAMVGINLNYFQNKFVGDIYRSPDTLQSNSITRGFAITPHFRSSIPLTANERLSFFTDLGVTYGLSTSLRRDTKYLDEVQKTYSTIHNLRIGISPGVTFFAMENFAFEVQLDLLGYDLKVNNKTVNDVEQSQEIRQNVNFKIDILSLELGLAYYFGTGKKQ